MRPLSLRLKLALSFALAVAAALVLFSGVVLAVLAEDQSGEEAGPAAHDAEDDVHRVLVAMLLAAPLVVSAAAGLGLLLAKSALAPLKDASARARAASSSLELTLPVLGRGDEWDELAITLNKLLAEGRTSMERIRRFTADAAHELRTPLTTILGEAGLSLRRERPAEELRASLATIGEAAGALTSLLEALLLLARADSGTLLASAAPVDFAALIREATGRAASRAAGGAAHPTPEGGLSPHGQAPSLRGPGLSLPEAGLVTVQGNPILLARAVENLVDNALRYGGGPVALELSTEHAGEARWATLVVSDQGPGISPALRPALFSPFARGDASRSTEGLGLGLSISRAIAAAHGGTLTLLDTKAGAAFQLRLPA